MIITFGNRICLKEGSSVFGVGGEEGRRDIILFCVPTMFSVWSYVFPVIFPKFSMCCSRVFPIAPHFYPIWLPKVLPSQVYRWAKGQTLHLHIQNFYSFQRFFFSLANENGSLQKIIKELGGHPYLINRN